MKRPPNPMRDDGRALLDAEGLMDRYEERPWYQRNDYLGWIERSKRADTREKRLRQMLDELRAGDVYMKMVWRPRRGSKARK